MKRTLLALGLTLTLCGLTHAINFGLSPLYVYREDVVDDDLKVESGYGALLAKDLDEADSRKILALRAVGKDPVKSVLQASGLCSEQGLQVLLYAKLMKSRDAYELEINVYDHEQKTVIKRVYAKFELTEAAPLFLEASTKTVAYLYQKLGADSVPEKKYWSGTGMVSSVSWYSPVVGNTTVMTGIAGVTVGLFIQPKEWWADLGKVKLFAHWGLDLQYAVGVNKPTWQGFEDHIITLGFPWSVGITWQQQEIELSAVPGVRFDLTHQTLAYVGDQTSITMAPTVGGRLSWFYWFDDNRKFGLGVSNTLTFSFYKAVLIDYLVGVTLKWSL